MGKLKAKDDVFQKAIFTIALPISLQSVMSSTASMVDTMMIGSTGELSVAAVGICSQFSSLFYLCALGFSASASVFFTQYWGNRDENGINKAFGIAITFMMAISLVFTAAAVSAPEFVLRIYTDKERIIEAGVPYMRIMGVSFCMLSLTTLLSALMRYTNRIKIAFISSVSGMIVHLILNWLLIYGRFGLPALGIVGAAIGTVTGSLVNVGMLFVFLVFGKSEIRIRLTEMFRWDKNFLKLYFKKCLPILGNDMCFGIGNTLLNMVMGRQSESAIVALTAVRVIQGMEFSFFSGISDAGSVIVGKEIGLGKHMNGYNYLFKFAKFTLAAAFAVNLTCTLCGTSLLGLFSLGEDSIVYGQYLLFLYLIFGTMYGMNLAFNVGFRAGGETIVGSLLEVSGLFILNVFGGWITGMVLELPFMIVALFLYAENLPRVIIQFLYAKSGKWVKPVTEEGKAALPAFREELSKMR